MNVIELVSIDFEVSTNSICGASICYVPRSSSSAFAGNWVMIVAHHKGRCLNLFRSEAAHGPWLRVEGKIFSVESHAMPIFDHVASPDLVYDNKQDIFYLSAHGKCIPNNTYKHALGKQVSFITSSKDLIDFSMLNSDFASPYCRVVKSSSNWYLFEKVGFDHIKIFTVSSNFSRRTFVGEVVIPNVRHFSVRVDKSGFTFFCSLIYGSPECLVSYSVSFFGESLGPLVFYSMPTARSFCSTKFLNIGLPGIGRENHFSLRDPYIVSSLSNPIIYFSYCSESLLCFEYADLLAPVSRKRVSWFYWFCEILKRKLGLLYRFLYWRMRSILVRLKK